MIEYCEAEMHAPAGRALHLILLVAFALMLGCRGSSPFGRYVQVTKSKGEEIPDIDAPQQRLATAKPRDSELTTKADRSATAERDGGEASTDGPDSQIASGEEESADRIAKRDLEPLSSERALSQTTRSLPASARMPSKSTDSSKASGKSADSLAKSVSKEDRSKSSPTSATGKSTTQNGAPTGKIGDAMGSDELLAALQDFPPELREQALRQFVASAARSAEQTGQPNTVETAIAKAASEKYDLPEPRSTPPENPPQRLAVNDSDDAPAVASISDSSSSSFPAEPASDQSVSERGNVATASVGDLSSEALEEVDVQTITSDEGAVKTVSAARSVGDSNMVSQAADPSLKPSSANSANAASSPAGTPAPKSEKELLAALVEQLSTEADGESEAERSSRLIKLRHLMVLSGDPDAAVTQIEGMADAEQEYLRHHLLGLWTMIDPEGHPVPSRRFTSAIPQIREAAKFAAAATDSLEVRSLAFCTEIESYGQITTFNGNRFEAGQQVILYCEIENFTVKRMDDGFETHLMGSYDVFNSKNEKVFSQVLPADQQVSANYLRDYFIAYQMHLPTELESGTYRLQLTMEDAHGKKYGQSSIPFEVAK